MKISENNPQWEPTQSTIVQGMFDSLLKIFRKCKTKEET